MNKLDIHYYLICQNPITQDGNTITNLSIKLVNIDNNNPSKKYKYNVTFDYDFDYQIDNKHMFVAFDNTSEQKMIATYGGCSDQLTGTFEKSFYSNIPYVRINTFSVY